MAYLRRHGMALGLDKEVLFFRLLAELSNVDVNLDSPQQAAIWFGPVLCSNARDQERLIDLVASYARERFYPLDRIVGDSPPRLLKPARKYGRLALAGLTAILLLSGLLAAYLQFGPTYEPESHGDASGQIRQSATQTSTAAPSDARPSSIFIAVPLGLALLGIIVRRRRQLSLNRQLVRLDPERYFDIATSYPSLFDPQRIRGGLRDMAARQWVRTDLLDLNRSVAASVKTLGRLQFYYAQRSVAPEYLVLV
jgi:hypothetical protein